MTMIEPATTSPTSASVPAGLRGVVVADTAVGDVRGDQGSYHYRGHSAIELAETRPFDDIWCLLVDGHLPATVADRRDFRDEVAPFGAIPEAVIRPVARLATVGEPLDALRSALSLVAAARRMRPMVDLDDRGRRIDALAIAAVVPTLVCAIDRVRRGLDPLPPDPTLGRAADLLRMLTGAAPDARHAWALDRYLVSTVDHGFNASTFTARVVASTGADLGACIVAALGALSGPLHGGAPSRARVLRDEIGTAARVDEVVRPRLARGERLMGFGHAVYRTDDPRSVMLRRTAEELARTPEEREFVDQVAAIERRVVDVLEEHRPGRRLRANVELYAGVVMHMCGIPREMFTPVFVTSRVVGWCAHAVEQVATGRLIRPSARYTGPPAPRPVPALAQ